MCLTIPKKVVKIDGGLILVEDASGNRQSLKTIVEVEVGSYVLSQQDVIIEVSEEGQAREMIDIFQNNKGVKI